MNKALGLLGRGKPSKSIRSRGAEGFLEWGDKALKMREN
jgi:hypothetical protein